MLLNKFCKPILANERNSETCGFYGDYNDLRLFLCSTYNTENLELPPNWCGSVFTSQLIMDAVKKYQKTVNTFQIKSGIVLSPNMPYDLILPDKSQMKLTMMPIDNRNDVMFLLEADQFISLLTNSPFNNFDVFVKNKLLRAAVKKGVDVLYVDDSIFFDSNKDFLHPTESQLRILVHLVQPRFVYGLSGEPLPQYIQSNCLKVDFYNE